MFFLTFKEWLQWVIRLFIGFTFFTCFLVFAVFHAFFKLQFLGTCVELHCFLYNFYKQQCYLFLWLPQSTFNIYKSVFPEGSWKSAGVNIQEKTFKIPQNGDTKIIIEKSSCSTVYMVYRLLTPFLKPLGDCFSKKRHQKDTK